MLKVVAMKGFVVLLCLMPQLLLAAELQTGVAREDIYPVERLFDGTVEAVNQATMSAQTSGRVEAILVDVDDYVERDSLVVQLRDTEQQARLKQAQASLSEAQARLRQARDEFERVKSIYARKLVAKAALDRAEADFNAARARAAQAEAAQAEAQEQLAHTRIRAPYSGIVLERHVEVGEMVQPGKPIMTGVSLEKLRVVASVPQRYVEAIRSNRRASLYWDGDDRARVVSEDITVYPYADPLSHGFRVRVDLPESSDYGLYPGMLVKVGFVVGEAEVLTVPREAIVHRSELSGVYVREVDGGIRFRHIQAGYAYADGRVQVMSGLETGEQVLLDPIQAGIELKRRQMEPVQ